MKKIWLILMLMLGNSTLLLSQYCHVGDVITAPDGSKGVVFYVNSEGTGGWMVALNDASSNVKWGNNGHVPNLPMGLTSSSINLLNQINGYEFTQAIRTYGNSTAYPAAWSVDFDNGWYLPAIGQLRVLISKLGLIESVLTANGGTTLSANYYWSSSESDNNKSWTVCMMYGDAGKGGYFWQAYKNQYYAVRAVRNFTMPSYSWSTGETTQEITVSPTETTTYTVTVTGGGGCDASASVEIVVNNGTHNVETVTECESYTWHEQEYIQSGTYVYPYTNATGCASADTLHLTINYGTHNVETVTECESYTWHEQEYIQSGTYVYPYTNATGCASADTLHLTINYGTHNVETITECESYTWHEQEYTQSGTYIYPYTNASGCASADTLHLTINYGTHLVETITECESYTWHEQEYTQSGMYVYPYTNAAGCASADTLHLTINYGTHNVETVTECESYTWHEQEYTQSGTYVYPYTNALGCASADTLHLTINYGTHNVETITECESYTWHEQEYTQSGTYVYPYMNASGCQSADTLHLTINYGTHNVENITECESYTWHEQEYTQSGTYIYPYTNASGCASADTLHLTISNVVVHDQYEVECEQFTWVNGETYTESVDGVQFIFPGASSQGCDSIVTLHLTINYGTHLVETVTECESYTWHEQEYTQSGTYVYPYTNASGCASADTLYLTINYGTHNVETITECESYTWHEQEYTQSGTYVYPYMNASGCQSADTLHLTINYGTHNVENITECESYTWHEQEYTQSGTYIYPYTNASGCASADTLHLTINYGTHLVETITECESYTWYEQEYTQSGTYVYPYTNATGCASADTLHLTINYGTHNVEIITECESYTWHEQEYTQSGMYVYPYTNAAGCASADTLHLTINYGTHNVETVTECESYTWHEQEYTQSGMYVYPYTNAAGCASADTLYLTINYGTHLVETVTECESYTWHEQEYTQSGTYVYPYTNASGCASADTLHLTINYGTHLVETIIECESYTWHEQEYTQSGMYVYPYTNAAGCASADTLHLTINYGTHNVETVTECESYTWHEQEYTQSGTYVYPYTNALGCASADTLHLTINYGTHLVETIIECESYTWHEQEYTQSGMYVYPYTNAAGCASADTLHLTINYGTHNVETITECESYTWHEQEYTQSGTYVYTYTNASGCASADTLHLTINYGTHNVETVTECESYIWHEQEYTQSGTYVYTYTNASGCASADTLHLTINYGTHNVETVTECESYTWHEQEYTQSGTYVYPYTNAVGCQSADTLHLTISNIVVHDQYEVECEQFTWVNGETYTESVDGVQFIFPGASSQGCDSIVTLHLTINYGTHLVETITECESYTWHEQEYTQSGTYVYPYTNAAGCASADTLYLTINYGTHLVETVTECESYTWHDQEYTQSGTYVYPYTNAVGCQSADTLHLTINNAISNNLTITTCDSYIWEEGDGATYTESGQYIYEHDDPNGCLQIDTLFLTINNAISNNLTITTCDSYIWEEGDGATYTESGQYIYEHDDPNGCLQIDTLFLTINNAISNNLTITTCESYTWEEGNGETYIESGQYIYEHDDPNGCLQIDTLFLTINNAISNNLTITTCESYTWEEGNGETYIESGQYIYEHDDPNGCLQIDTLFLTINNAIINTITDAICSGNDYTENGFNIINPPIGVVYDTLYLTSSQNCDSTVYLVLTVDETLTTNLEASICAGNDYTENGFNIINPPIGVHHDTLYLTSTQNCDSTVYLILTVDETLTTNLEASICAGNDYTENGFNIINPSIGVHYDTLYLTSTQNCDSTVYLVLTVDETLTTNLEASICAGNDYTENGFNIINPPIGVVYDTLYLTSTQNCDSTVYLVLTVDETLTTNLEASICAGNDYTENGFNIINPPIGVVYDTLYLTSTQNCDSTVYLILTVDETLTTNLEASICAGNDYIENGFNIINPPIGVVYDTLYLTSTQNCDSTVYLVLTVDETLTTNLEASICAGNDYTENGFNIINPPIGVVYDTLYMTSTQNCDSTVYLILTVDETLTTNLEASICAGNDYIENGFNIINPPIGVVYDTLYLTSTQNCDSTVYLVLTVDETLTTNLEASICAGNDYTENGFNIINPPIGVVYDTLYLTSTQNCDSTVYLVLTVDETLTTNLEASICAGNDYTENGFNIINPPIGVVYDTLYLTSTQNCDSTVYLVLTVDETLTTNLEASICAGNDYTENGFNIINPPIGVVYDTLYLTTSQNCDSTVYLILTVDETLTTNLEASICAGNDYTENGFNIINPPIGVHHDTLYLTSTQNCDSTVYLVLTVDETLTTNLEASICAGNDYTENGFNIINPSIGVHYDTLYLTSTQNCDSTVYLVLTVDETLTTNLEASICAGNDYTENGFNIINPPIGVVYDTLYLTSTQNCDSTVYLVLTVDETLTTNLEASICAGNDYTENGFNIINPPIGVYYDTLYLTSTRNCDSTVYLVLTVIPTLEFHSEISGDTLAPVSANLIYNEHVYSIDPIENCDDDCYTWHFIDDCDWEIIPTGNTCIVHVTSPGDFTLEVRAENECGMDYRQIKITGVQYSDGWPNTYVYPNPATNYIDVMSVNIKAVVIVNSVGIEVLRFEFSGENQTERVPLDDLSDGLYFIYVENAFGRKYKRIIVEH